DPIAGSATNGRAQIGAVDPHGGGRKPRQEFRFSGCNAEFENPAFRTGLAFKQRWNLERIHKPLGFRGENPCLGEQASCTGSHSPQENSSRNCHVSLPPARVRPYAICTS